ncbi:MAG: hypothetical protein M3P27_01875 [Acidobacteriota bacterium]|nr:hypothetical protein [Acidobacteriota bacterium]
MVRLRTFVWLAIFVVLAMCAPFVPLAQAGKKPGYYKKPGTAQLPEFAVVTPAEKCSSWGWAAATESILALDSVNVDQHVLVQKAFGGELCDDGAPNLRKLGEAVNGEYVLSPKKKMRVVARVFLAGTTIGAEDLIAAVRRGRPMIFFWRMHAYIAVGVAYDEYIGANGARLWEVRELTLLDPTADDAEHRFVTFQKGRDDLNEINGAMEFVLIPMEEIDWVQNP